MFIVQEIDCIFFLEIHFNRGWVLGIVIGRFSTAFCVRGNIAISVPPRVRIMGVVHFGEGRGTVTCMDLRGKYDWLRKGRFTEAGICKCIIYNQRYVVLGKYMWSARNLHKSAIYVVLLRNKRAGELKTSLCSAWVIKVQSPVLCDIVIL